MANSAVIGSAGQAPPSPAILARTQGGILLRLCTWLRRPWLDRVIAHGLTRPDDCALALREAQLVDRRERIRLAVGLERVLTAPSRPPAASSAAPVDREAVDLARPILTELVLNLRSSEAVEPCGVVLGWRLLTDPASPIYATPRAEDAWGDRLRHESLMVLFALRPLAPASTSTVS